MKRFWTLYKTEQKLGLRCPDGLIFGVAMPAGKAAGGGSYTFLQSAFASLMAVGICASAFMGIPLTIADYRDKKILKHFFVTPCSPMALLAAVVACGVVTALISGGVISLLSVFVFGYRMQGNVLLFVGAYLLVMASMYSIGMLISGLCRSGKTVVYFPMLFLSGATIPFELFPEKLQKAASILPLTQGIKMMKEISMGSPIKNVAGIVLLLTAVTAICCFAAKLTFRWE